MIVAKPPEQEEMEPFSPGWKPPPEPRLRGNGCKCVCCGGAPAPIDPEKIKEDGGKFVRAIDGRVIEYFVFGSAADNARILLIINGSMGTGWVWGEIPGIVNQLLERNIKAICITLPGYGHSTPQARRQIGNWPKDDVEPVFYKEEVDGEFMVEGAAYGSAHAMAVAHYFGSRVSVLHLIVPYLPIQLREELEFKKFTADDAFKCDPSYANLWRSCCLFCCCSCLHSSMSCCPACCDDGRLNKASPGSARLFTQDVIRSAEHSVHGWVLNAFVPTVSDNWGFDPREIEVQKVLVSYAEKDLQCDAAHGRFLAQHFTRTSPMCVVNRIPDGHDGFNTQILKGDFIKAIADM